MGLKQANGTEPLEVMLFKVRRYILPTLSHAEKRVASLKLNFGRMVPPGILFLAALLYLIGMISFSLLFGTTAPNVAYCAGLESEEGPSSQPLLKELFSREISGKKGLLRNHAYRIVRSQTLPVMHHAEQMAEGEGFRGEYVETYLASTLEDVMSVCDQAFQGNLPDMEGCGYDFVSSLRGQPPLGLDDVLVDWPTLTSQIAKGLLLVQPAVSFCLTDLELLHESLVTLAGGDELLVEFSEDPAFEGLLLDSLKTVLPPSYFRAFFSGRLFRELIHLEDGYSRLVGQMLSELEDLSTP